MNLYEINCDNGDVYPEDQEEMTFLVLAKDAWEAARLARLEERFYATGKKRVYTFLRCEDIKYKDMPEESCVIN